ncbi:hypothetical protein GCM10027589_34120 [Actinocorallia lasiicapitis]
MERGGAGVDGDAVASRDQCGEFRFERRDFGSLHHRTTAQYPDRRFYLGFANFRAGSRNNRFHDIEHRDSSFRRGTTTARDHSKL